MKRMIPMKNNHPAYYAIFIFLLLLPRQSMAQQYSFMVNNCPAGQAYIHAVSGEKLSLIDSVPSGRTILYTFNPKKHHYGFYRLQFSSAKWIDFIYDDKPLLLETDFTSPLDSARVLVSDANKLFYEFIFLHRAYKVKSELLLLMLNRYPKTDVYHEMTRQRLRSLQSEYVAFINGMPSVLKQSFTGRYIRSMQAAMIPDSLPPDKQLPFLKSSLLSEMDFNDVELTHSDVFTNKAIEYLTLFRNPQLPKELLEKEFFKAVDTLLLKARFNQFVYRHIAEYLIDGFKRFGFDAVLDYIVEKYVIKDDLCLDSKTESMIHRRIEQARVLAIGRTAPLFSLPDTSGKIIDVANNLKELNLIVFYATWCPHCKTLLPQLQSFIAGSGMKLQSVFAISLDTEREKWVSFIRENGLRFINAGDMRGWESKAVEDYFIYATPTMFLVDRNLKILGKPTTLEELKALL